MGQIAVYMLQVERLLRLAAHQGDQANCHHDSDEGDVPTHKFHS
jgi:hypothetical protein